MGDIDLNRYRKRIARGRAVHFEGMTATRATVFGQKVTFCTDRRNDPIQDHNRGGRFYELEELQVILRAFPIGGVFVDIGANIGNHTLFFALFGHASQVIPIEPNPLAYRMLLANVVMNDLAGVVDLRHLGLGLSDGAGEGFAMQERTKNLGGAKMLEGQGDIPVRAGDEVLGDVTPAMIKIDVEGMEMRVLAGLKATIARDKPVIFVEVDRANYDAFDLWLGAVGYKKVREFSRYRANTNYLIVPDAAGSGAP